MYIRNTTIDLYLKKNYLGFITNFLLFNIFFNLYHILKYNNIIFISNKIYNQNNNIFHNCHLNIYTILKK